jgi:hypothetical protein
MRTHIYVFCACTHDPKDYVEPTVKKPLLRGLGSSIITYGRRYVGPEPHIDGYAVMTEDPHPSPTIHPSLMARIYFYIFSFFTAIFTCLSAPHAYKSAAVCTVLLPIDKKNSQGT